MLVPGYYVLGGPPVSLASGGGRSSNRRCRSNAYARSSRCRSHSTCWWMAGHVVLHGLAGGAACRFATDSVVSSAWRAGVTRVRRADVWRRLTMASDSEACVPWRSRRELREPLRSSVGNRAKCESHKPFSRHALDWDIAQPARRQLAGPGSRPRRRRGERFRGALGARHDTGWTLTAGVKDCPHGQHESADALSRLVRFESL